MPADSGAAPRPRRRWLKFIVRFFVYLAVAIVLLAFVGYLVLTQWLAKPETIRSLAVSQLARAFPDKNVKVAAASFSIVSGLSLYGIELAEKDTGVAVARLGEAHVDLDYGHILRGKVLPRNARALDLFVDLVRREDGTWNISLPATSKEAGGPSLSLPFSARLESAFVSFDDRKTGYSISFPVQSVTVMSGVDGLSEWRATASLGASMLGIWRVSAVGNTADRRMEARFAVTGIDGGGIEYRLPPGARKAYRFFKPSGPMDFEGRVAYAAGAGWDWSLAAALRGVSIVFEKFPVPVNRLEGKVVFGHEGYAFKDLKGESGGGKVTLSGSGGYSGDSAFTVTLAGVGLTVDEPFIDSMPRGVANALRPFHASGRGGFDATVTRDFGPRMPVNVAVEARLEDMDAVYDFFPLPLEDLRGRVVYANHAVLIDDLAGKRRGAGTGITVDATVSNIRTGRPVHAEVAVSAADLVIDDALLAILPKSVSDRMRAFSLTGSADVKAEVAKTSGEPLSLALDGWLKGAGVFYQDFPYRLGEGSGEVSYADDMLKLKGLTFRHGGADVGVSGSVSTVTGASDLVIAGRGVPVDDEVRKALPESVTRALVRLGVAGVADADVAVTRAAGQPIAVGEAAVRLRHAQFMEPTLPIGVGDAFCDFVYDDGYLAVSSVEGFVFPDNVSPVVPFLNLAASSLPPVPVSASGRVPLVRGGEWSMRFDADRLLIDAAFIASLPRSVADELLSRDIHGSADCSGALDYRPGDAPSVDFDLDVAAREMHATVMREFTDVAGRIRLTGGWQPGASSFTVDADLSGLRVAGLEAGATSFVMRKTGSHARFDRFSAEVVGGAVTGQGRFALEEGGGYGFTAQFRGLDLRALLTEAFGYSGRQITGTVDGDLAFLSPHGRPGDAIGSAYATISRGTLWEVPFILGVLDILNLQLPERQAFQSAEIRTQVSERKLLVDEFSMSSDPATLYGRGTIGLDGSLDLTLYAQPGRIPIISLIAGQVGKNIVRVHVGGDFDKPQITLIASGFVGSVLDWIGRPFRAMFGGGR